VVGDLAEGGRQVPQIVTHGVELLLEVLDFNLLQEFGPRLYPDQSNSCLTAPLDTAEENQEIMKDNLAISTLIPKATTSEAARLQSVPRRIRYPTLGASPTDPDA
jgi:hypothetical protein